MRALHNFHAVEILVVTDCVAVHKRFGHLGFDVLVQGATESHVKQLQTPADAEDRFAGFLKRGNQRFVVVVTQTVARPALIEWVFAIAAGPDIGAAMQHQPVQPLGVVVKADITALGIAGRARHHHHHGAGGHDPVRHCLLDVLQGFARE